MALDRTNKILISAVIILSALLVLTNLDMAGIGGMVTEKSLQTKSGDVVKVDLFAMSLCPHCAKAEKSLVPVLTELDENVRFNLFFVMYRNEKGLPQSPRGLPEAVENARQVCIQEHFPASLPTYIVCMADHQSEPERRWEFCATGSGADTERIRTCVDGDEGRELLWHNTYMAEYMGIQSSPRILINGEMYTGRMTYQDILKAICYEYINLPRACQYGLDGTGLTGMIIGPGEDETCSL